MASRGNFETEPTRVAGGHKAALKNPNVSKEAKEHSRAVLEELEESGEPQQYADKRADQKDEMRVNAGLKSTLHNPNTSTEAKESAEQTLKNKGAL